MVFCPRIDSVAPARGQLVLGGGCPWPWSCFRCWLLSLARFFPVRFLKGVIRKTPALLGTQGIVLIIDRQVGHALLVSRFPYCRSFLEPGGLFAETHAIFYIKKPSKLKVFVICIMLLALPHHKSGLNLTRSARQPCHGFCLCPVVEMFPQLRYCSVLPCALKLPCHPQWLTVLHLQPCAVRRLFKILYPLSASL
jgi:hypothetical protein